MIRLDVRRLCVALALLLTTALGCAHKPSDVVLDQCHREKLFHQCLAELPAGPSGTKYNDWDEVVTSCDNAAMYQSRRQRFSVKIECLVEDD